MDVKLRRTTDEAPKDIEVVGKLSALLRTEAALEEMLAQARREAEQSVANAQRAADASVQRFRQDLETEVRTLRGRVGRELAASLEEIRTRAHTEATVLEAIDDATVERLARELLHWLAEGSDAGDER